MRFAATIAALLLGAQALPLDSSDKDRLDSIDQKVHRLLTHEATSAPTVAPSKTSTVEIPTQAAAQPPQGLLSVSDPKPVSDCYHSRSYWVDPYRIFFYVPPTPYGYKEQPNVKLVVSISTRWGVHYTKQLRKKIEAQTGLVSIKEPEYWSCGWYRELKVKAVGVHRGDVDISLDHSSAVHMNKELKRKLEHILRATYPGVEIFLILFFTLSVLAIAILRIRAHEKRLEAAAHSKAKATIHGTGAGIELRPRNTVPQNRSAASLAGSSMRSFPPPSYRLEL